MKFVWEALLNEFTGERVIPGQVDVDLWNEHVARYVFASRLSRNKRVLDLACGTGYGSSLLARDAQHVYALDLAPEAVAYAKAHYSCSKISLLRGSAQQIPFPPASFHLIVAFEIIEHLADWEALLLESRRLLAPSGQLIISTPNRTYYGESRKLAGPNPFHAHEFTYPEFQDALNRHFPHISFFLQNHASVVSFQPLQSSPAADVTLEVASPDPRAAHFFVAVCALAPQTGSPTFVYLPASANVLREREQHIARLEQELIQKSNWLAEKQKEHQSLLNMFHEQQRELESRNQWAWKLDQELQATHTRIVALQVELEKEQASSHQTAQAYETKIAELESECATRARWALDTEQRLTSELQIRDTELAKSVELLHEAEKTVEERTLWAQRLERERQHLDARLSMVQASRWYKMGRRFGLGPEVRTQ